jgi:hypothetical protein
LTDRKFLFTGTEDGGAPRGVKGRLGGVRDRWVATVGVVGECGVVAEVVRVAGRVWRSPQIPQPATVVIIDKMDKANHPTGELPNHIQRWTANHSKALVVAMLG